MNRSILTASLVLAFSGISVNPAMAHGHNPCGPVWKACSADANGDKDKMKSCMETIKGGGKVDGVNVADSDVKACQAAPKHHHHHHDGNSEGNSQGHPSDTPPGTGSGGAS